jgi:transcriptional regulator with XRE-family HTH domain
MTIGEMIAARRSNERLTLRELADLTGISNPMLSQYETEKSHPSFENAAKLSQALDFSLDKLAKHIKVPKNKHKTRATGRYNRFKDMGYR